MSSAWSFFLRKPLFSGVVGSIGAGSAVAWQSRPLPVTDHGQEWAEEPDEEGWHQARGLRWNDRVIEFDEPAIPSIPVRLVRGMLLTLVTSAAQIAVRGINNINIVGNLDDWDTLQSLIIDRPPGTALLTVANHTSIGDDPGLMASLVGLQPVWQEKHRWGICAQDMCFKNEFSSTFCGAGKVLPINRGAGVDQPLMAGIARKLAMGEWVHMFPEGVCVQTGKLGAGVHKVSRPAERISEVGTLKWGVGKLIAHSSDSSSLIVVPFYHMGMHQLFPQHNTPDDNSVIHPTWVYGGNDIFVRAGKPIDFSELLKEYEQEHGTLRKLALSTDGKRLTNWGPSSSAERELYARITRRVEEALLKLECESSAHVSECKWAKSALVTSNAGQLPE